MTRAAPIGDQAVALGHTIEVVHHGKRFTLHCSCGWETPRTLNRQMTYLRAGEHCLEVVRAAQGVSQPDSVSGGL